jgi:thymidylate kinase
MARVTEIVLTGGPAAGKTLALAYLQEKLTPQGVRVFTIPEVATLFAAHGIYDFAHIATTDRDLYFDIERQIVAAQSSLRKHFLALADLFPTSPILILHDRAELDAKAYLGAELFRRICHESNLTEWAICDSYSAVIFMRTTALAPETYSRTNNQARYEEAAEAVASDARTYEAWKVHPRLTVIENYPTLEAKLERTLEVVQSILGLPSARPTPA